MFPIICRVEKGSRIEFLDVDSISEEKEVTKAVGESDTQINIKKEKNSIRFGH